MVKYFTSLEISKFSYSHSKPKVIIMRRHFLKQNSNWNFIILLNYNHTSDKLVSLIYMKIHGKFLTLTKNLFLITLNISSIFIKVSRCKLNFGVHSLQITQFMIPVFQNVLFFHEILEKYQTKYLLLILENFLAWVLCKVFSYFQEMAY